MKKDELDYIEVKNSAASAKITLQGAHIFEYKKAGEKLLYLSQTALFKKGKAIRGGIPICWPWFGAHPSNTSLPNHGFARTSLWVLEEIQEINPFTTEVLLSLKSSKHSRELWPYDFKLSLKISVGNELKLTLTTYNLDRQNFTVSSALHTYFEISDIEDICLSGLEGKTYYNKVDNSYENIQEGEIKLTQELDRIYQEVTESVQVKDKKREITIKTEGSQSIVVWNPGKVLAERMPDLSHFTKMLCVESANALKDTVEIKAGKKHTLTLTISQTSLS